MSNIRNFCIIAHIDHGKSTLADRFLEITGTVPKQKMRPQMLDQMDLERERGITIKLQPVRMNYKGYILNLIDTPGHMDFHYEVMRSLEAVEAAILLVDAVKGVQAQTLSNLHLAQKQDLRIIPVINKIDLTNARVKEVEQEIKKLLDTEKIIKISAKFGTNIEQILEEIINLCPAPKTSNKNMLVFDAFYDSYKGVIAYIRAFKQINGAVGVLLPKMKKIGVLKPGEIGYLETGEKNLEKYLAKIGWQNPQSMVFASIYPAKNDDFSVLKSSLHKLKLNDAALSFQEESSGALGRGFKAGFLGMLHLEITAERLKREYNLDLILTAPQVNYINDQEPWVALEIISPSEYLGPIMNLLKNLRAEYQETQYLSNKQIIIKYEMPLSDIITDFYDNLKSASSGYGSMSYKLIGYRPGDLVKLEILIAHQAIKELEQIVPKEFAYAKAKNLAEKLKEIVPKQNFAVAIQVAIDGQIIARETIPALKKDVTGYLYGGDYTRKMKLLQKQKRGKKKLEKLGKVNLPSEVFMKLLRR
ncbi:MAG: elongation factor 4 [Candidatus Portnoybacteria bacterium CG23_combo_of_CG06-09_8_20_14_all_37_13]|uniref:Elongation factor 4 n=1 Tax=Candidatus Portnoybacteria bacterium CG23_combo_of_CG06-09_8_20_14_all_37_13 TaxID=1974819 RepID=A0A2G9YCR8_9BACT|nr:MAG: elongation factor 4 [Candidatus Portnoybacteria bacterium CG23_combo_of_CG06-09_8_20_14_all_37_13]